MPGIAGPESGGRHAVQGDTGVGGAGIKTGCGVAEVHPAPGDDFVGNVTGVQLLEVVVAEAAAHPGAAFGQGDLGNIAALCVEGGEGLALGAMSTSMALTIRLSRSPMGVPSSPRFSVRAENFTATVPLMVSGASTVWVYITLPLVLVVAKASC